MVVGMDKKVKSYLAEIGSRGGKKSRRVLTPEQARRMVAVREARRAFRRHSAEYFWSYRSDAKIEQEDIPWVVRGMQTEGDRRAFEWGRKIRRLLREAPCR
jgi:hypothetical protein